MTEKGMIQQLVRAFEVKRLTSSKLHDVRHQLLTDPVCPTGVNTSDSDLQRQLSDRQRRALTRRLVHEFNSDGSVRRVRLRADENQLTDVQHFENYLRSQFITFYTCSSTAPQLTTLYIPPFYTVSQKNWATFSAYNFRNIEQIFTKFGTNQSLFILNIAPEFI